MRNLSYDTMSSLTLPVGIAAVCSIATAYYFYIASKDEVECIEGTLNCPCGKVTGRFQTPSATPTAVCHCHDCTEFASWCKEQGSPNDLRSNHGGVPAVQLYKCEFQWSTGVEHVERLRLRDSSPLERICTTCCHTPLGFSSASLDFFPFLIMHTDLLTCTSKCKFRAPDYRLNVAKMTQEARQKLVDARSTIVSDGVSASFFMRLLKRMIYGIFMGYGKPDPMTLIDKKFRVLGFKYVD